MKKIWARIGISCIITDEEYKKLKNRALYKDSDGFVHIGEATLNQIEALDIIRRGIPENDSFIPAEIFHDIEKEKGA